MTAAVADMSGLDGPLSPELVLVSPPELAERARRLLPESPFVLPVAFSVESPANLGLGFVVFVLVCLASTVGPFLLAVLARTQHY